MRTWTAWTGKKTAKEYHELLSFLICGTSCCCRHQWDCACWRLQRCHQLRRRARALGTETSRPPLVWSQLIWIHDLKQHVILSLLTTLFLKTYMMHCGWTPPPSCRHIAYTADTTTQKYEIFGNLGPVQDWWVFWNWKCTIHAKAQWSYRMCS